MLALLNEGLSKPKIAKAVGVSVASVYNVLAEIPNEKTIQAMKETRAGKNLESFDSVDDLMADLNA